MLLSCFLSALLSSLHDVCSGEVRFLEFFMLGIEAENLRKSRVKEIKEIKETSNKRNQLFKTSIFCCIMLFFKLYFQCHASYLIIAFSLVFHRKALFLVVFFFIQKTRKMLLLVYVCMKVKPNFES